MRQTGTHEDIKPPRRTVPRSVRRACVWLLLLFMLLVLCVLQLCQGMLKMLHTDQVIVGVEHRQGGDTSISAHSLTSVEATADEPESRSWQRHKPMSWQVALGLLRRSPIKFVVVDVKNGLGNRLRAMASARSVASALHRPVLLVWQPDLHCNCSFRRLFEPTDHTTVLEQEIPQVGCKLMAILHPRCCPCASAASLIACTHKHPRVESARRHTLIVAAYTSLPRHHRLQP